MTEPTPASEVRPGPADGTSGALVLVVDDEDAVRRLVRIILDRGGFRVITAGHPRDALELAKKHADEIDLILTDVVMPSMSGSEFAAEVRQYCSAGVIYMSGYTDNAELGPGPGGGDAVLIEKPFSADQLLEAVRRALGE